jgi:hypothetical protein
MSGRRRDDDPEWRQGEERRSGEDRRSGRDRRSGGDRRGPGAPVAGEPAAAEGPVTRRYVFRAFTDRRAGQDRRIYRADGDPFDRRLCGSARSDPASDPELRAVLTEEEIRFLFAQSKPRR